MSLDSYKSIDLKVLKEKIFSEYNLNNFYSLKKYVERNGSFYTIDTTEEEKTSCIHLKNIRMAF